ncbi:GNAT family N-acetyltransferase [Methylomonas sp. DH-1]|uniref:GNAT family N-acetyltransferase n=1 Tax=Methylomonas sp. (strain DH-1) TaxID=1727196 RepID=UPI0007C8D404|nr:GNAT family N-acetyltransferase [Methylomonas sp. DH-1]ANE56491.1 hypothetical protein AYM39_15780 [Methylomonas sp. DH-1]
MYTIEHYPNFAELPQDCTWLHDCGFFYRPQWFEILQRSLFADTDTLRIYAVADAGCGRTLLLAVLRHTVLDSAATGADTLAALSHPENFAETPLLFHPAASDRQGLLTALFRHLQATPLGNGRGRCDALRLWPLADGAELEQALVSALQQAGFRCQRYANSYNRYETTAGLDYAAYFAARSANLRYSVRRRQRALEKTGQLKLELYTTPEQLQQALSDYIAVSMTSWKRPETMFNKEIQDMMRLAAELGCLRLGILRLGEQAAAVQFWLFDRGVAHCVRLAYREEYKHLAVGVVLTNFMIAHALDRDRAASIDFGFGVEDYKGGWMKQARDYYGVMAFNPATAAGNYHAARNILGQRLKRGVKTLLRTAGLRK